MSVLFLKVVIFGPKILAQPTGLYIGAKKNKHVSRLSDGDVLEIMNLKVTVGISHPEDSIVSGPRKN